MNKTKIMMAILIFAIVGILPSAISASYGANTDCKTKVTTDCKIVKVGKTFTVTLNGNPSTGYKWTGKVSNSKIKLLSTKYVPNPNPYNLAGSGGKYVFKFKCIKQGTANIKFSYARSWESKAIETKKVSVKIVK
ncbi:MAG: protease inhibitor I42 family protein [Methanobacteriaceae archaeon]